MTDHFINNKESVRLAIRKIAQDAHEYIASERASTGSNEELQIYPSFLLSHIVDKYNGGDPNYDGEVSTIFDKIIKDHYNNHIPDNFDIITG